MRQGWVTVYNLDSMERVLNGIFHDYGHRRGKGIPLYLTEWDGALHTNPPDPFYSITLAQQSAFTDQGEYMTWRVPYVKTLCQFLLVDDSPNKSAKKGSKKYYNTPTGGLGASSVGVVSGSWKAMSSTELKISRSASLIQYRR